MICQVILFEKFSGLIPCLPDVPPRCVLISCAGFFFIQLYAARRRGGSFFLRKKQINGIVMVRKKQLNIRRVDCFSLSVSPLEKNCIGIKIQFGTAEIPKIDEFERLYDHEQPSLEKTSAGSNDPAEQNLNAV